MRFLFSTMEKLPNGCRLRRFAEPCGNILLAFPCQLRIVVLPIYLLQSCRGCRSGIGAYLLLVFCFCLTLQLLVLLKGFIQLSRILFLLLIQLVQAGLHGCDFALHRLDARIILTAEIQQKVFFFRAQLFNFLCERRDLSGQVVLLDAVQFGGVLLFCHQGLASFGFLPDLLRKFIIPLQLRLNRLDGSSSRVSTADDSLYLIADHDQLFAQFGQLVGDGGGRIGYKLSQHGDQILQLPQQRIVGLDLPVQLAAVGDDALLLQRTGSSALVDSGLLVQSALGMAAMVNTFS